MHEKFVKILCSSIFNVDLKKANLSDNDESDDEHNKDDNRDEQVMIYLCILIFFTIQSLCLKFMSV